MASQLNQNPPIEEPKVSEQSNNETCKSDESDVETEESDVDSDFNWETDESDVDSDSNWETDEKMERTDWEMDYLEYQRKFQKYYDDGRVEDMEEAYLDGEEDFEGVLEEDRVSEESSASSLHGSTTEKEAENISDLLSLNDSELQFNWAPIGSFKIEPEKFFLAQEGPTFEASSPLEAFRYFWDDTILKYIVDETNRKVVGTESFNEWIDTDSDEMLLLFSFYMMQGISCMPTVEDCFSDNDLFLCMFYRYFKEVMTLERFLSLESACFANYPLVTPSGSFFNEHVFDYINDKFQKAYVPGRDIYIDESQTLSKGEFKYLLPNTTVMKSFELSETDTEYLVSLIVYAEKDLPTRPLLESTKIVKRLITPFLNQGYRVFLDHRLNSTILARFLKKNHTDCVGTVVKSSQNVPNFKELGGFWPFGITKIPKGSYMAKQSGDIVAMTYQNKKSITLISTCHDDIKIEKAKSGAFARPNIMNEYNKGMGKVDLDDKFQYLKPYMEVTKRKDWYKTLFKQCLNASINNARVIYNASTGKKVSLGRFRLLLLKELIKVVKPGMLPPVAPNDDHNPIKSEGHGYCEWCDGRTKLKCDVCDLFLCSDVCFKDYHANS